MRAPSQVLDEEHRDILEAIASGRPLAECLTLLTDAAWRLQPETRACVVMANADRTAIAEVIGTRVPQALVRVLVGLPIDVQDICTCTTAIQSASTVTIDGLEGCESWSGPWKEALLASGVRACQSTPIVDSDGKGVASFLVLFDQAYAPDDWDGRISMFGAHIASIAIARERTMEALRDSRLQLEAELADTTLLATLSTELVREDDNEALYKKLLDAATVIMRADFASMQMLYPECGAEGVMKLMATRGFTPEAIEFWDRVPAGSASSCGHTMRSGTRTLIPDVEAWAPLAGTSDLDAYRDAGIRAVQSTPLINRSGGIVGIISTHWRRPHEPSARDFRVFDLLVRQAADLVERRQADKALQDRNHRLDVLSRISAQLLLADQHDARLLTEVFSEVARAIDTELFFNFLTNDEPRTLKLFTSGGLSDGERAYFATIKFGEFLCGTVAEHRELRVVENLEESVFPEAEALRKAGVQCYAGLPLVAHGRLIGTIAFATKTRSKFREGELQLLQSVCDQVAATLDRARLFASLEASEKRIRHITETMPQKMFTADANGNVDYFNQQWIVFTGLPFEEIRDWGWTQFIHPDDVAENVRLWQHAIETGTPFEFMHRFRRADEQWRWHLSRAQPLRDAAGNVVMWAGANTDIHEQKELTEALQQREAALIESEHRFRHMADHAPVMVWVTDADGSCTYLSQSWYAFTGQTEEAGLGFGWLDATHPEDRRSAEEMFAKATTERMPFRLEYRLRSHDGTYRWAIDAAAPRVGADGRFLGFIGSVIDITERKQAETTQQLLIGELSHRVKNMLANVQSIMQQTLRRTPDPTVFAAAFSGRLQSLSRVHSLLSDTTWQGADMRELVRDQLVHGPVDETRVLIRGPHLKLEPQMALHLALMLHELGTNAIKYGAHSTVFGRVVVDWDIREDDLLLSWTELGGPRVTAPSQKGFGSTLIEASAKAVGGSARMHSAAAGVIWTIEWPLPSSPATAEPSGPSPVSVTDRGTTMSDDSLPLQGRRFLVVEDEPLIGLEIVSLLEELGISVTGPVGNEREALEAIQSTPLDMALLDANLSGLPVDAIAAALTSASVPFVFVTGYSRDSLPAAFNSAPVLSKPFTTEQLSEVARSCLPGEASATELAD